MNVWMSFLVESECLFRSIVGGGAIWGIEMRKWWFSVTGFGIHVHWAAGEGRGKGGKKNLFKKVKRIQKFKRV